MTPAAEDPAAPRAPEVRFRRVEKGAATHNDIARMLDLLATAFDRWPGVDTTATAAEHLRWKMSSPGAIFSAFLGEAGDQLVSTETVLGYRVLLRGREAVRMQFVATAVKPEWRGRGVSSASLSWRQRTVTPIYDLSIIDAQSTIMIQRARPFGTRPLGNKIHRSRRPAAARAFTRRAAGTALRAASRLPARTARSGDRHQAFQVVAIDGFDSRIDPLFAAAAPQWEVVIVRSREHLDWRYDRRGGNFHLRVAEDAAGTLLGYAVANARGERGHLVDLMALPARLDVITALVAAVGEELSRLGCAEILCEFLAAPETRVHFTLGDTDLV